MADSSTFQSKAISKTIGAMETFIAESGQTSAMASLKFQEITQQIGRLGDYAGQVKLAMNEQSDGSRQILDILAQMNRITSKVQDGSSEMLEGSHAIRHEMLRLLNVSELVRDKTTELSAGTTTVTEAVTLARQTSVETISMATSLSMLVSRFKREA